MSAAAFGFRKMLLCRTKLQSWTHNQSLKTVYKQESEALEQRLGLILSKAK